MMKRTWIIFGAVCSVSIIGCATVGADVDDLERPQYTVVSSFSDNIEIREYAPLIVAEVEVQGDRRRAINNGFRLLADYIFGNNSVQQDIAMTAPVQQQSSEKIAMTVPVQQQGEGAAWKISFVMPSEYSIETLPRPNNDRVALREIPAQQFIVIEFSGTSSATNISKHEKRLMQSIEEHNIQTVGSPKYAFYNPPLTLPSLRRNEIMLEIADSGLPTSG